jgi:hypothetical protein
MMKYVKSAIVGFCVATVFALLYSIFYLRTIQVVVMPMGGFLGFEPPLIHASLIVVFVAAFALCFFWMIRRQT